MTDLDDQEYLIRGALARELGDIMDSDAETLVQNTVALTDAVMQALHGPQWRTSARAETDKAVLCRHCGRPIAREGHPAGWWHHVTSNGKSLTAIVPCYPDEPRPGRGSLHAEPEETDHA
jgi:hypothetical protein